MINQPSRNNTSHSMIDEIVNYKSTHDLLSKNGHNRQRKLTIVPGVSQLSNFIKQTNILEGIKQRCRQSDAVNYNACKVVSAAMGLKAIARNLNGALSIDPEKSQELKVKYFNMQTRKRNRNMHSKRASMNEKDFNKCRSKFHKVITAPPNQSL